MNWSDVSHLKNMTWVDKVTDRPLLKPNQDEMEKEILKQAV